MSNRITVFAVFVLALSLIAGGCGSSKAATTSTPPTTPAVTTTQPATLTTTSAAPTSTAPASSTVPATITSSTPPPSTSAATTTKPVYIIHATLSGVDDLYPVIKVGTTVRWTPLGHEDRTLVSDIPGLFGGYLSTNPYVEYTFNEPGKFYYHFAELPEFSSYITVTAG